MSVTCTMSNHAIAALAMSLDTEDPDVVTDWLDRRISALYQEGDAIELAGTRMLRTFAPSLNGFATIDLRAADRILARVDCTELAIHLAQIAAWMYAHAFGPHGLTHAQAALQAFATPAWYSHDLPAPASGS
jgi:hypothetical protein